ncbi:TRAP transporter, DctM subunit [Devosia crocina]|uniref:TRAP transporter large permease protein n=1 Tax=Devosia crocina TaxID=429728 RepID=A0A1I7N2Z0_9HYPH|nr:TRAP transporter large permease [Devosia crocina]SFV29031.1 TRAP transporter, DctM subunit [Devosia crocina]
MLAEYALPIMIAVLVITTIAGLPMGIAMISSSVLYLFISGRDVGLGAEMVLNGIFGNFAAVAVPLFIFAANIMDAGKISDKLLNFCLALVGRLPGGMAQVNIMTSLVFSGMSGSAISDAAGVGKVVNDMMTREGRYPKGYAGALTAATAVVGPIFPPSIPMVYYALVSSASIGALFLGGVVPALIIVAFQFVAAFITAKRRGFPVEQAIPWRLFPMIFLRALPALLMPVILLGGIYTGVFTPTEAAAVSAFYALMLALFAYRTLNFQTFKAVVYSTVKTTAVVSIVLCGAFVFNYVIAIERIPQMVYEFFAYYQFEAWMFLLLLNILFLLLGCFLDVSTIQLVIVPLFIPTALALGIDLVHLGVVLVLNMMIGLITPPMGMLLFVIKAVNGIPISAMIKELWPHLLLLVGVLFLITYVPDLVLWLPRQAGAMQ